MEESQPEELNDSHSFFGQCPRILITNSKEKLQCRKVNLVLRYNVPNRHEKPGTYAHHLLSMFYPFRIKSELKRRETVHILEN